MQKTRRIGKRERAARKKRFRTKVTTYDKKTGGWLTLKLGHKKMTIHLRRSFASVCG